MAQFIERFGKKLCFFLFKLWPRELKIQLLQQIFNMDIFVAFLLFG